jgi:cystathionine gamma-lyase
MVTERKNRLAFATRTIHAGQSPDPSTGAVMVPIYATSTYAQESPGVHKGYEYSRSQNPTRMAFERCIADLESGTEGFAFASGLAAIATVLELLSSGDHVVATDDIYGGSYRLFERVRRRSAGLDFSFVDVSDPAAIEAALKPNTKMIWVETPTNPLLKLADIASIAALAKKRGLIAVADNTFASPYVQRPLELGLDIVVHSTTKYLNGHSDMVGGCAVVGDNRELVEQMKFLQNSIGAIQGPFDSFLALRGLKTLALRMERHCSNGLKIARWLEARADVTRVIYPGLESHPQHARSGRHETFPRALPALHARRKPGRRRKPHRASRHHDPRLDPGGQTRQFGYLGFAGAPVLRSGGLRRSDWGFGAGAGWIAFLPVCVKLFL